MAHEIDCTRIRTGAAFYAREPAWHRLGTVVAEAQTSADAITLAGLDFEVVKYPLLADPRDGRLLPVPDRFATVRTDTSAVLGDVGADYTIVQNREAFAFMDAIIGEKLAIWDSAGSLKCGRRVWMLAKLPKTVEVTSQDLVDGYVLVTSAHDGTMALRILPTMVRVVCWNTLMLAIGRAGASEGIALRHRGKMTERIEEARTKLGIIAKRVDTYGEQAHALARRSLSIVQARDYFSTLCETRSEKGQTRFINRLVDNLYHPTNDLAGMRGTLWAAYNAVSWYADHQMHRDRMTEKQLASTWFGAAAGLKDRAWKAALALVN